MSITLKDGIFQIATHKLHAQHLREHPHAVADESNPLFLSVKQYIPISNLTPQEGDLTIILSPAAGIAKEAYEPFLHDLDSHLSSQNTRIRAIWTADPTQTNQSALLNKDNLGNDFSWFDHSRDLLCMIQHFRELMPRPLVGIGHSMGGSQITWLALMHPGLFECIVLIEPNILRIDHDQSAVALAKTMLRRRETWESREQAEQALRRNPFYEKWDTRVVEKLVQTQFVNVRDSASAEVQASLSSSKQAKGAVATSTPRDVEFHTIFSSTPTPGVLPGIRGIEEKFYGPIQSSGATELYTWYPPASVKIALLLTFLKCKVFYVVGEKSEFSTPSLLAQRMRDTGTGFDGSGGAAKGMVEMHVLKGGGHFDIFDKERGREVVDAVGKNLARVWKGYGERKKEREEWKSMDPRQRQSSNGELVESLKSWSHKGDKTFDQIVKERSESKAKSKAKI